MKFLAVVAALSSVALAALPQGVEIGLLVLRSTTPVHLSSPRIDTDGKLVIRSDESLPYFSGIADSQGYIKIVGSSDKYLAVGADNTLQTSTTGSVFDSDGYYFVYNNSQAFTAVSAGSGYDLVAGSVSGTAPTVYSVALRVITNEATTSGSSATSTSGASSTTSELPQVTTSDAAQTTLPQVNGASSYGAGAAAALAGVAGILLL